MRSLEEWFSEYGESHQNHTNKLIHWVCVPAIFFSIIGLLYSIPIPVLNKYFNEPVKSFINFSLFVSFFVLYFYLRLSFNLFLGILFIIIISFGICYLIETTTIPLWLISLITFIIAWIGKFYGHIIEGKKPSFLKDLQFLLIGPAWVLAFFYRKMNIKY